MSLEGFLNLQLPRGDDDFNITYASYENISQIPDLPGIYSWHIHLHGTDLYKQEDLFNLFHADNYEATLVGNFQEKFQGILNNESEKKTVDEDCEESLLRAMSVVFGGPVYIGKSYTSVRSRLESHQASFGKYYDGAIIKTDNRKSSEKEQEIEDDSEGEEERENNIFGYRLAQALHDFPGLGQNSIMIKSITFEKDYLTTERITQIELFLNKLYKPLMGLK